MKVSPTQAGSLQYASPGQSVSNTHADGHSSGQPSPSVSMPSVSWPVMGSAHTMGSQPPSQTSSSTISPRPSHSSAGITSASPFAVRQQTSSGMAPHVSSVQATCVPFSSAHTSAGRISKDAKPNVAMRQQMGSPGSSQAPSYALPTKLAARTQSLP